MSAESSNAIPVRSRSSLSTASGGMCANRAIRSSTSAVRVSLTPATYRLGDGCRPLTCPTPLVRRLATLLVLFGAFAGPASGAGHGADAGRHATSGSSSSPRTAPVVRPRDHRAAAGRPERPLPARSGARPRHGRGRGRAGDPDRARPLDAGDRRRDQRRLPAARRDLHLAAACSCARRCRRAPRSASTRPAASTSTASGSPVRGRAPASAGRSPAVNQMPAAGPGRALHAALRRTGAAVRRCRRGHARLVPGGAPEHRSDRDS